MTEELKLFWNYAAAFEKAYADDNWNGVEPLFDEDIHWAVAGLPREWLYSAQGSQNTSNAIKTAVAALDRRFDNRVPAVTEGPNPIPGGVHFEFTVTYTRLGLPDFVLRGEEWDLFRHGKIALHFEAMHNGEEAVRYLAQHDLQLIAAR